MTSRSSLQSSLLRLCTSHQPSSLALPRAHVDQIEIVLEHFHQMLENVLIRGMACVILEIFLEARMNAATRPVLHASMMLTVLDKITVHKDPASTDQGVIGDIEDNDYWIIKIFFKK